MRKLLFLAGALLLAAAAPASAQIDSMNFHLMMNVVDPPLYVTNESGKAVDLAWQTTIPGQALSPARNATVAAGAKAKRIDPGLFWIVKAEGDGVLLTDNTVYLSTVDSSGGYAKQIAVHADFFSKLANVKKAALDVTIDADGGISVAPRLDQ